MGELEIDIEVEGGLISGTLVADEQFNNSDVSIIIGDLALQIETAIKRLCEIKSYK
ncbi:hypothetical protein L4D06_22210 [Enterovibrio makurazakiensis]|uniref:hypothetical protein n=1 Tax=Enterovibrio makurazakiensis TaxID=2910232 RepID=UPI003D215F3C